MSMIRFGRLCSCIFAVQGLLAAFGGLPPAAAGPDGAALGDAAAGAAVSAVAGSSRPAQDGAGGEARVLRAAVTEFPPYAVMVRVGEWDGSAVELFRATARDMGYEADFVGMSPADMLRGLERGEIDAVSLPLTADPVSAATLTLTPAFDTSSLHIAVVREQFGDDLFVLARSLVTPRQLRVYAIMFVLVAVFASVVWLLERRRNSHFRGPHHQGIGSGLWWSITTLSTVGYGDKVPISAAGRAIASVWMLLSLILVALFTATVTSSIAAHDASATVTGPHDLLRARVGIVEDGLATGYVNDHFLPHVSYPRLDLAMEALRAGELDAVLGDSSSLERAIEASESDEVRLLDRPVQRSPVSFGLRKSLPKEFIQRFEAALVARLRAPEPAPDAPAHALIPAPTDHAGEGRPGRP